MIDHDFDALFLGVFQFPVRRLEELARLARHDLDVIGAQAQGRAAAIHRSVADANDQYILADAVDVLERHGFQPVDSDMDVLGVVTAGQLQLLAARRAGADENRVVTLAQQFLHALDRRVIMNGGAHVEDVADFLIEHIGRQTEGRNVVAHQAAGHVVGLKDGAVVSQRQQVVRHGQRSRAGADQCDFLAVLFGRRFRQAVGNVAAMIRGHALEPADGHRFLIHATAAAGRFAGPVADAAENAGEHVAVAVDHVGVIETALGDQADVFGNIGMSGAAPLAVDDLVEIVRIGSVCPLHAKPRLTLDFGKDNVFAGWAHPAFAECKSERTLF